MAVAKPISSVYYGSILNIGYALIGVVVATPEALAATFTYIAIYMLMTAGVFAVLLAIRRDGRIHNDFSGLSRRSPYSGLDKCRSLRLPGCRPWPSI